MRESESHRVTGGESVPGQRAGGSLPSAARAQADCGLARPANLEVLVIGT